MRPKSRSQFEQMRPGEFAQSAEVMADLIRVMQAEGAKIEAAQKTVDNNSEGAAWDEERDLMARKLAGLHADVDQLVAVQQALGQAAQGVNAATNRVHVVLHEVESDGFKVADDWAVTPESVLARLSMLFLSKCQEYQRRVDEALDAWDKADHEGSTAVSKPIVKLEEMIWSQQPKVKDGEGRDVPIIVTPNGDRPGESKPEDKHPASDLDVTIPGWPHMITGDVAPPPPGVGDPSGALVDGVPGLVVDPTRVGPDGKPLRALPTGANYGPDGKTPLAGFSFPDGLGPDGKKGGDVAEFASPDTTVFDMSDPKNPARLGVLKDADNKSGISQGSWAYDSKTKQMVVVGNTGNGDGSPRAVWKSDPVKPGDPPDKWMSTLHKVPGSEQPITPGVNGGGDRENQVRQLPSGKWAVIDAKNGEGVRMYVADRPEDLFKGQPQQIARVVDTPLPPVPPGSPPGAHYVQPMAYGASVTDVGTNPDGSDRITVRTSGWPPLMVPDPDYGKPGHLDKEMRLPDYSPQTYTSTVQVGK